MVPLKFFLLVPLQERNAKKELSDKRVPEGEFAKLPKKLCKSIILGESGFDGFLLLAFPLKEWNYAQKEKIE